MICFNTWRHCIVQLGSIPMITTTSSAPLYFSLVQNSAQFKHCQVRILRGLTCTPMCVHAWVGRWVGGWVGACVRVRVCARTGLHCMGCVYVCIPAFMLLCVRANCWLCPFARVIAGGEGGTAALVTLQVAICNTKFCYHSSHSWQSSLFP